MVNTYVVITKNVDLQHNYSRYTSGWELAENGPQDYGLEAADSYDASTLEAWTFSTNMPGAVERMLDTDQTVVAYEVINSDEDAQQWWK